VNSVALVTGGTRGIGLGIARCLAARGFHLALCGIRNADQVSAVISELNDSGIEAVYLQADIARAEERARLVDRIRKHFGHLEILVNNAGVAPKERRDILDATEESFERVMKINLQGPYFLTQAVARWMVGQKSRSPDGRFMIINISSISATVASVSRGEYCLSKAGIAMATRLWAVRLAEYDIPVYELRPGLIRTDMTAGIRDHYDRLIEKGLLLQRRWGTPEDVGRAVTALAGGDLPYSTGESILIDGGLTVPRL